MKKTRHLGDLTEASRIILSEVGDHLRLATPLGLGKPNQLINLIYRAVKDDPKKSLKIYTALSLQVPQPKKNLEKRFLNSFLKDHFGEDYPHLDYATDAFKSAVPKNIAVHEFYFQAGQYLHKPQAQMNYVSLNYTHVAQTILDDDINVIVQLISSTFVDGNTVYSLSCNSDLTLDVVDLFQKHDKKLFVVGVVHPDLAFLGGEAQIDSSFFDIVVESPEVKHKLFATPRLPISEADHLIGLHASQMIKDDGTLQIGIGSLSDALVNMTVLRQKENVLYKKIANEWWHKAPKPFHLHQDTFQKGLYGTSEMVMDGFMHLRKADVLKRWVYDHDETARRYLHGAFFLGSKELYGWLQNLRGEDFEGLSMTRVSKVNDLYDPHELAIRRQRKNARFFNTCMNIGLLGGAASETLSDGQVISGVGGQYNFIAMSRELPDSFSVLMLRSTRTSKGKRQSNIVWSHDQLTIPRHLRDVVITEYGIAFLRGKTDEQCIEALIEIADSEFQEKLIEVAQKNGKLSKTYQLPAHATQNTPEKISEFVQKFADHFSAFPLGSDFTPAEEKIAVALSNLKDNMSPLYILKTLTFGIFKNKSRYRKELERMQCYDTPSIESWFYQKLLLGSL